MKISVCLLVLGLVVVSSQYTQAQFVSQDGLAVIEEISVNVSMTADSDSRNCLPFESTIKTRIELALQRAGFYVVETGSAGIFFEAVAISLGGTCAVGHDVYIFLWNPGYDMPGLALSHGGIFSRPTLTGSKREVRRLADDATDMVINEILKARRNR